MAWLTYAHIVPQGRNFVKRFYVNLADLNLKSFGHVWRIMSSNRKTNIIKHFSTPNEHEWTQANILVYTDDILRYLRLTLSRIDSRRKNRFVGIGTPRRSIYTDIEKNTISSVLRMPEH